MAVGDVARAIAHGMMILPELGTTMTSGRVLRRLRPVREAASTARAAEFCERFDAAAAPSAPPDKASDHPRFPATSGSVKMNACSHRPPLILD